jgi:hypothetical protein
MSYPRIALKLATVMNTERLEQLQKMEHTEGWLHSTSTLVSASPFYTQSDKITKGNSTFRQYSIYDPDDGGRANIRNVSCKLKFDTRWWPKNVLMHFTCFQCQYSQFSRLFPYRMVVQVMCMVVRLVMRTFYWQNSRYWGPDWGFLASFVVLPAHPHNDWAKLLSLLR